MRHILGFAIALTLASTYPSKASSRTWQVHEDGSGDAPTIQAAIDSSSDGDEVVVNPGTYSEHVDFIGKQITVRSAAGPEATIVDGSFAPGAVVTFGEAATRQARLEGLTITGGTGNRDFSNFGIGGGIFIYRGSPTICENIITGNRADGSMGGGIYSGYFETDSIFMNPLFEQNIFVNNSARLGGAVGINRCSAEFRNNIVSDNHAIDIDGGDADGGGLFIWLHLDHVIVEGNQFIENTAEDHGGAVAAWNSSELLGGQARVDISGNLFLRNEAEGRGVGTTGAGGALHVWGVRGSVTNNTIVFNHSTRICEGGGAAVIDMTNEWAIERNILAFNTPDGFSCYDSDTSTITDNMFWENGGQDFSCLNGTCPIEEANIVTNPLFCAPEADDFTVRMGSPALPGGKYYGAFPDPGCAPVSVEPMSWGRIKARYRTEVTP